jgi:hypothetical protein
MTHAVHNSGDMDSSLSSSSVRAAFAVDVYPNEYFRYIPNADTPDLVFDQTEAISIRT